MAGDAGLPFIAVAETAFFFFLTFYFVRGIAN